MAYYPPYQGYPPYYGQPVPDQLAQLRQNQFQQQPVQTIPQQMQVQPQPMQASMGTVSPMAAPQNNVIWVKSKSEADNWAIVPGSAVALWDENNPVVYLRKADSTGKPSTVVYDLVERTDSPAQATPQIDLSGYVTIEAAEEMIERRVNEILSERLKRPSKPAVKKEDTDNG